MQVAQVWKEAGEAMENDNWAGFAAFVRDVLGHNPHIHRYLLVH